MSLLSRFTSIPAFIFAFALCAHSAEPIVKLSVDATDARRHLYHATLTIPVKPGPLTLPYPKWIPGHHRAAGPIVDVVGLAITGAGKPLVWKRDLIEMYVRISPRCSSGSFGSSGDV